jgi:hypothetical protein
MMSIMASKVGRSLIMVWMMIGGLVLAHVKTAVGNSETRPASRIETVAEQTNKALEQIVSLDLYQYPLSEAVRLLGEQSGVRLVLDRQGLSQAGLNPDDMMVSTRLSMTLRSGLRQMLSQYALNYAIIGDMVLITTEDLAIRRQMRQRVSVRFDRLQLKAALEQLARETATNLVLDRSAMPYASTPVTLNLDDAPLEVVVKLLAYQARLKQIRVGNVIMVTTKKNAAELREDAEDRQFVNPNLLYPDLMFQGCYQIGR